MTIENKCLLITGGTGSLGKALIKYLMENTNVRRIAFFLVMNSSNTTSVTKSAKTSAYVGLLATSAT